MSDLQNKPISYGEQVPGDLPDLVYVVFDWPREGIWKTQQFRFEVDQRTADLIKQYCEIRSAHGQSVYQGEIERAFGITACN